MSAASPVPTSTTDPKPREPSMEEILASIRRIIADDQSFTRYGVSPEPNALPPAAAPEAPTAPPPPTSTVTTPEPRHEPPAEAFHEPPFASVPQAAREHVAEPQPSPAADDLHDRSGHGSVTPQFPGPSLHAEHLTSPAPASEPEPAPQWDLAPPEPEPSQIYDEHEAASLGLEPTPSYSEPEESELAYDAPLTSGPATHPQEQPELFSAATDTAVTSAFNVLAATRLADNSEELMGMVREMIRPLLRSWLDDNLPSMVERMVRAEIERVARGGK